MNPLTITCRVSQFNWWIQQWYTSQFIVKYSIRIFIPRLLCKWHEEVLYRSRLLCKLYWFGFIGYWLSSTGPTHLKWWRSHNDFQWRMTSHAEEILSMDCNLTSNYYNCTTKLESVFEFLSFPKIHCSWLCYHQNFFVLFASLHSQNQWVVIQCIRTTMSTSFSALDKKILGWWSLKCAAFRRGYIYSNPFTWRKNEEVWSAVQMENEIKFPEMVTYCVSVISFYDGMT